MTEIFVEPELENLQDNETAEEWYSLCVDLGLSKQAQLADKSEELKAPPYMFIDPKTERIIEVLCPRGVHYKNYNASTIPLDILQEIQKCEKNGWYNEIHIHYDDKSPDPFVVGIIKTGSYSWENTKHLIARWGAELLPFEQLESKAVARLRDAAIEEFTRVKFEVDYALSNMDAFLRQKLAGKQNPQVNLHISPLDTSLPF